jgi:HEAT repeats/Atypical Arm repeat
LIKTRWPCIHGLLSSPDTNVRANACTAIGGIVSNSPDQLQIVFEHNLTSPLLQCLADADPDAREAAAWAVSQITVTGTPEQTQRLVQEGCIPLVCELLDEKNDLTVSYALEIVDAILFSGVGARASNPMAALVSEAGGVGKMKHLLRHGNKKLRKLATRLCATYFSNNDCRRS